MSDDIVRYRQEEVHLGGGDVEYRYVESKDGWIASYADAKAALDTQAAEITRLRAERNAEISARFKAEGEFSTMQRRIARQRRALAKMYQRRHHRNALINHLIAALATARRDALAEIKQDTDELIEQGRQDGMEQAAQIADGRPSECGEDIAAAIRAAAGEGK